MAAMYADRLLLLTLLHRLPAPRLLAELRGDGSEFDQQRMSQFREALKAFEGNHAFHNYTKMRWAMGGDGGRSANGHSRVHHVQRPLHGPPNSLRYNGLEMRDLLYNWSMLLVKLLLVRCAN